MNKREAAPAEWRTPTPAEEAEIARILAHTDAHTHAHRHTHGKNTHSTAGEGRGLFFAVLGVLAVIALYLLAV